jgi:uncharacterized protein
MRIGVLSDTHCPEFMERLPDRVFEALAGVDLILHAGDVNGPETLKALSAIAPVQGARGDHDPPGMLPLTCELTLEGRRIVVVHGNRSRWIEEPETFLWTVSLGSYHPHGRLATALLRRHPTADLIVFGHTHRPFVQRSNGVLLFNPGGVHQWNRDTTVARLRRNPGWFEWSWLQVARHIREWPQPSVGILELSPGGIEPRIVPL